MTPKRRKLRKVLDVREHVLEERALELAKSKTQLQDAQAEQQRESERLLVAEKHRAQLVAGPVDVGSWIEAEQWLAKKKQDLGRADGRVASAEAGVNQARQGVVEARIDKKRIELLDGRLAAGESRRENRVEQRLADELSLRKFKPNEG